MKYKGRGYDANPISLGAAAVPWLRCLRGAAEKVAPKKINGWLFCSEFVASVYIDVGIFGDLTDGVADGITLDPKNVLPVDFIGGESDEEGIHTDLYEPVVWLKSK